VIERGAKALIAVNDHYTAWQNLTGVQTTFPAGTVLKDYSGANGNATVTVNGSGQVNIAIPPCDGSAAAGRKGYSVWAPIGINTNYVRPSESITQEWEMADDLGDSSPASLQQGGSLPSNSRDCRVVGRIFPDSASAISVSIYPENPNNPITLEILNAQCEVIDTLSASGTLTYTANASNSGWHTLRIRNTSNTQTGQKCWVKATYTAPQVVNTTWAKQKCACAQTGAGLSENPEQYVAVFPNPFNERIVIEGLNSEVAIQRVLIYNTHGALIMQFEGNQTMLQEVDASMLAKGIYYLEVRTEHGGFTEKIIKQ
jgi:alpha-amylase